MFFLYNEAKMTSNYFLAVKAWMKGIGNGKNGYCEIYY